MNIPANLANARKVLAERKAIDSLAEIPEFGMNGYSLCNSAGVELARFNNCTDESTIAVTVLSRNGYPAVLRVVEELLDRNECVLEMIADKGGQPMRCQVADIELALALLDIEEVA